MTFTIFTVVPPQRTLFDGTAAVFFGVGATDITDCQHATSIPTLSTGGVIALSSLLLGLGTLMLYRIPRLPGWAVSLEHLGDAFLADFGDEEMWPTSGSSCAAARQVTIPYSGGRLCESHHSTALMSP